MASRWRATTRPKPRSRRAAARSRPRKPAILAVAAAVCSRGCLARTLAAPTTPRKRAATRRLRSPATPRGAVVATAQADAAAAPPRPARQGPPQTGRRAPMLPPTPTRDAASSPSRGPIAAEFIAPLPPPKPVELGARRRADAADAPGRTRLRRALVGKRRRQRSDRRAARARPTARRHHARRRRAARRAGASRGRPARAAGRPGCSRAPPRSRALAARSPQPRPGTRALAKAISNETTAAIPARAARRNRWRSMQAGAANPYGGLITDGFNVEPADACQMTAAAAP